MSVRLDELVGATRDARRRGASASARSPSSSARSARAPRGPAVRRGAVAARHLADRRAQAPLAVGRRPSARARAVAEIVRAYERGGAAALSVLTEEAHFGGSLADLREARAATELPILRKDFTVDPYQLYEARPPARTRCCWSSAALEPERAGALYTRGQRARPRRLVEVHDEEELDAALEVDADVIGINNRDLEDFTVDIQRTFDLLADVPAGKIVVSEAGIRTRAADRGARAGGRGRGADRRGADARARSRGGRAGAHRRGPRSLIEPSSPVGRTSTHGAAWPTVPELDPPQVAELGARLRENIARAVKAPGARRCATCSSRCSPRATC